MLNVIYDTTMRWAMHRYAPVWLAVVSFAESSFLPIPPDLMLVPMSMANPKSAWRYAFIATCSSVLGGVLGYSLGKLCGPIMLDLISKCGSMAAYLKVHQLFEHWGFAAVLLAGATPIPYKIFTIGAGILEFNFCYFVIASLIGRGVRFFILSSIMKFKRDAIHNFFKINRNKEILLIVVVLLLIYIFYNTCI